ncbi:MAG: hypothetical protein HOD92_05890 [Deltaproteobacteria bacterium]|jgi:hypothetical protein|nr:hypothetical protein [Deltaproteobacteria bacterium]MBT4528006.1 hypothetical protein [Deltaproteobacteria bacterium]
MHNSTGNQKDQDFIDLYFNKLAEYVANGEEVLHLEAMNSFYRRLVHNLANDFKLKTHSEGEGKERHIVISRTDKAVTPKRVKPEKPKWDFGEQEFLVNSTSGGINIFLGRDGNIGIYDENQRIPYLDKRLVTSSSFKIKNSKIVISEDSNW